jgi:hypothetical protein
MITTIYQIAAFRQLTDLGLYHVDSNFSDCRYLRKDQFDRQFGGTFLAEYVFGHQTTVSFLDSFFHDDEPTMVGYRELKQLSERAPRISVGYLYNRKDGVIDHVMINQYR